MRIKKHVVKATWPVKASATIASLNILITQDYEMSLSSKVLDGNQEDFLEILHEPGRVLIRTMSDFVSENDNPILARLEIKVTTRKRVETLVTDIFVIFNRRI